jgi:16S rRNA processing protein RimM
MSNLIDVGQITGAHGIKGWVKIHSQTEPAENIFFYQPWHLKTRHGVKPIELVHWQPHGKGFVAQVKGVDDRNQAEALCPVGIAVDKALLPELPADEFYWHQLEGCRVISVFEDGQVDLGCVKRMMPTGANDVLVVAGDEQSLDQQERLIPYVPEQYIKDIDIHNSTITVDWDPEF